MLVLTRKHQEKIRIGDNITITILRTKGKAVRVGIEAPAEVPVLRGELAFEDVTTEASARTEGRDSRHEAKWDKPRTADVSLQRVPRDKVASILPGFVSGGGPLRGMMDLRSTVQ